MKYSHVPNKRTGTLIFSKQICLFWQVLTPIIAVFVDKNHWRWIVNKMIMNNKLTSLYIDIIHRYTEMVSHGRQMVSHSATYGLYIKPGNHIMYEIRLTILNEYYNQKLSSCVGR